jgi:hypothetical protein
VTVSGRKQMSAECDVADAGGLRVYECVNDLIPFVL